MSKYATNFFQEQENSQHEGHRWPSVTAHEQISQRIRDTSFKWSFFLVSMCIYVVDIGNEENGLDLCTELSAIRPLS